MQYFNLLELRCCLKMWPCILALQGVQDLLEAAEDPYQDDLAGDEDLDNPDFSGPGNTNLASEPSGSLAQVNLNETREASQ